MATSRNVLYSVRHFLYPLNPKSTQGYIFKDVNGAEYPTSYEGFMKSEYQGDSQWGLSTNFNNVRIDDMVWAYFSKPDGSIRAVGRIAQIHPAGERFVQPSITIKWDHPLTDALANAPIPYEAFKQRIQRAALQPDDSTLKVLNKWLARHQTTESQQRDAAVRFTMQQVEARLGQPEFRAKLLRAYESRCALSGCDIDVALEAAHIRGVSSGGTHAVSNGLLLRADLHTLLDVGYLTISDKFKVLVRDSIRHSQYGEFHGKSLTKPVDGADRPALAAIRYHRNLWER